MKKIVLFCLIIPLISVNAKGAAHVFDAINQKSQDIGFALYGLIQNNKYEQVKLLLKRNDIILWHKNLALTAAIKKGAKTSIIEDIIQAGASVNQSNPCFINSAAKFNPNKPLNTESDNQKACKMVMFLEKNGAKINQTDLLPTYPLKVAVEKNNWVLVRYLLNKKVYIPRQDFDNLPTKTDDDQHIKMALQNAYQDIIPRQKEMQTFLLGTKDKHSFIYSLPKELIQYIHSLLKKSDETEYWHGTKKHTKAQNQERIKAITHILFG